MCSGAQLYSLAETPPTPPPTPPPLLGSYTRALLVSQDRQHLFVTPWLAWIFEVKINVSCQRHQTLIYRRGVNGVGRKLTTGFIATDGKLIVLLITQVINNVNNIKVPIP
jgi:hypothetical protein